jgi:integrase
VKGTTVKKELALVCRVIGMAMREWNIHLAFNPASAARVARPPPEPGDERDRRLEPEFVPQAALEAAARRPSALPKRRVNPDAEFERDLEIDEILAMPQSEQQALLRAVRYAHWFTQVRRSMNAATLRRRAAKKAQAPVKAGQRKGGRQWAIFSFAIETAMRRGELCKLRWTHVHLSDGYMLLPGHDQESERAHCSVDAASQAHPSDPAADVRACF